MALAFAGGAYNKAAGTRDAFGGLTDDLVREGHPAMISLSGDREPEVQERLWYERMTLDPGNRKVYGYRFWNGQKWYQIHPDTVAPPRSSNHEARRSNDLKWPYNDPSTTAHKRARILATRHNITCEGLSFSEPWHWTFWGALGTIDGAGSGAGEAEDDMPTEAWLNGLGKSIIDQTVAALRPDLNTVHQAVLTSREAVTSAVATIRADLNYIHVLSPYSLKAILEASKDGTVQLTDAQAEAIAGRLSAAAVAGIDAALKDDFDGVKARLAQLPAETITALKSAL